MGTEGAVLNVGGRTLSLPSNYYWSILTSIGNDSYGLEGMMDGDDEVIRRMEYGLKAEAAMDRSVLKRGVIFLDEQGEVDGEKTATVNRQIFGGDDG
jgi:hypothetical protein